MSVVASLLAEETHVQLPVPPPVFGLIFLVGFIVLAIVVWSYRDVANRHPQKSAAYARTHDTHHEDRTGADH